MLRTAFGMRAAIALAVVLGVGASIYWLLIDGKPGDRMEDVNGGDEGVHDPEATQSQGSRGDEQHGIPSQATPSLTRSGSDPTESELLQILEEQIESWRVSEAVVVTLARSWMQYGDLIEKVLARSPDAAHLRETYYFIQREDLESLEQSEEVLVRNILGSELEHLLEHGVEWNAGTSERDLQYSLETLRSRRVMQLPAETILRMPQFGFSNHALLEPMTADLQLIRLEFLLEYSKHEWRWNEYETLKRDPRFASVAGQSLFINLLGVEEASLRDIQYQYLRALAEAVNAPQFPDLQ